MHGFSILLVNRLFVFCRHGFLFQLYIIHCALYKFTETSKQITSLRSTLISISPCCAFAFPRSTLSHQSPHILFHSLVLSIILAIRLFLLDRFETLFHSRALSILLALLLIISVCSFLVPSTTAMHFFVPQPQFTVPTVQVNMCSMRHDASKYVPNGLRE